MPQTTIEHVSSVGSYHSPLLMEMIRINEIHSKYFKFIYWWVENKKFLETLQEYWDKGVTGNPMWRLNHKIKKVNFYSQ